MSDDVVRELQARVEHLQAVADNVPAMIAYWDDTESCRFANRAYDEWFGLRPEAVIGKTMLELLGEPLYQSNKLHVDAALRGERQLFERPFTDAKGEGRHVQVSYVPDLRAGRVHGFFALVTDITDRKRAELRLEESRAELSALLAAVPEMICSLDRDGVVVYINRTFRFSKTEVVNAKAEPFFAEDKRPIVRAAIEAAFVEGRTTTFETSSPGPSGEDSWFACQMSPVVRDGKTASALLVSRDITEKKRFELQLAASERLASVGSLAAGVAHEINTPVQFVNDSIHFLRDANGDLLGVVKKLLALLRAIGDPAAAKHAAAEAEQAIEQADLDYVLENVPRAIDRALSGLQRVTQIVRSLKEFAHPEQKELVEADLHHILEQVLIIAEHEYKYVADVTREFGDLPLVPCQIGGISQVFLNIVVNAAHAIGDKASGSGERGRITVRTSVDRDYATVAITDTGTGIPEAVRRRVFDPFFTTKEIGKGTGQGLAIASSIVTDKHNGQLWFETEVGTGTTFFIRLPLERYSVVVNPAIGVKAHR